MRYAGVVILLEIGVVTVFREFVDSLRLLNVPGELQRKKQISEDKAIQHASEEHLILVREEEYSEVVVLLFIILNLQFSFLFGFLGIYDFSHLHLYFSYLFGVNCISTVNVNRNHVERSFILCDSLSIQITIGIILYLYVV